MYLARGDRRVLRECALRVSRKELQYFAVAALRVEKVYPSHAAFAAVCERRHYVSASATTNTPPNIVASRGMENAAPKAASVLFRPARSRPGSEPILGSADGSGAVYRLNLKEYAERERSCGLRVAVCRFLSLSTGCARRLTIEAASLVSPPDWADYVEAEDPSFNGRVYGHIVRPDKVEPLLSLCFP